MSVTMNTVSVNQNTNFKGSYSKTEQGNQYYKTSAGTTAGAVLAVPAFALNYTSGNSLSYMTGFMNKVLDKEEKEASKEFMKPMEEIAARAKKFAIPMAVVAAACTLGCGMIVDHIRNKRAQEVADLTKQVGVKGAMMQGEGVAISQKGRTYYDSNVGSKYGALLGAGCGLIKTGMEIARDHKLVSKLPGGMANYLTGGILTMAEFALGGWLMGKIADHNTNKAAERKA